jgi:hypothetical protein
MNIPEMTDAELCEAISLAREPKLPEPIYASVFPILSPLGAWVSNCLAMPKDYWQPINWLEWSNTGTLLEELPNVSVKRFGDKWICGSYDEKGYLIENMPTNLFDNPRRAICETWLTWKRSTKHNDE